MEEEKTEQLSLDDIKKLSISEMYRKVKLPKETMNEILKVGDASFEKMVSEKYKLEEDKDKEEQGNEKLKECYSNLIDVLREYCDIKEEYYNIIALWIIGTYFHGNFPTYPYLFINAMKGSGKSRLERLIVFCSNDGSVLNSLTEAVLFRTTGTLGIDEFEGISRKGNEALKELLNSAYKKGITVKRMKKMKTMEGEKQVVEEFNVYRPIVIANIGGIEPVLSDRCLVLIVDKSDKTFIINLIEIFEDEPLVIETKKILSSLAKDPTLCRLCHVVSLRSVYRGWNSHLKRHNSLHINDTNNTNNTNDTNDTNDMVLYNKIIKAGISGRELELVFPLFIIAREVGNLDLTIQQLQEIILEKRQEDAIETTDISLIEYVSQETEHNRFIYTQEIVRRFREFLQSEEEWINDRWLGRALKRLNLIKEKRRRTRGREVMLDISKAQEKLRMFK